MLFSCQKSSAFYGVPPGWEKAVFSCQFSAVRNCLTADDSRLNTVFGGAERDRTADPLVANQVLSQLSYSPTIEVKLVGLGRVELPTSPLSGVRSSQLSYRPIAGFVSFVNPGGAGRDRTGDLLNANQALSQLSYSPF